MASTRMSRGVNWKPQQDIALCESYIIITEDGSTGNNQDGATFWNRVYNKFLEKSSSEPPRSREGIECRWEIINYECGLWLSSLIKARKIQRSSINQEDVDNDAKHIFYNDHKPKEKMFKLGHAWNILKDFPKWQDLHQSPMERSSQNIEEDVVSLDDDESMTAHTPMSRPRPEGRDKQKTTKKKGKIEDASVTICANYMSDLVDQSKELNEYRRRKLQLIEEQVTLNKEEKEEKIMAMDLSIYTPRKKKYWSNKQDAIIGSTLLVTICLSLFFLVYNVISDHFVFLESYYDEPYNILMFVFHIESKVKS